MLPAILLTLLAVIASGLLLERRAEARDAARFPPSGRLVELAGRRLHLDLAGSADGPLVVIEQGAGSPSVLWRAVFARIAGFARVCLYDRAGMLWSDPAPGARSLEDRVADLHALLAAAGLPGPCILVGHSYGGLLIRLFGEAHPAEVAGLVLVDVPDEAVVLGPAYQRFLGRARPMLALLEGAARLGLLRLLARLARAQPPPGGLDAATMAAAQAAMIRPGFFRVMADELRSLRGREAGFGGSLGDRPVAVIGHGQPFPGPMAFLEAEWPAAQRRLAALSADGEIVAATGSNHMIHLDQPELVVDAVRRVWQAARDGRRLAAYDATPPAASGCAAARSVAPFS